MSTSILARILTSVCKSCCSWHPPFSGLFLCENAQDSARTHAVKCYSEILQSKTSTGKRAWGEVQGNRARASKSSLPVESQGTHLIPRAMCLTAQEKCCLPGEALQRLSVWGFYQRLVTQAASARQVPKCPTARGKAGLQCKTLFAQTFQAQ